MATGKVERKNAVTPRSASAHLSRLSDHMYSKTLDVMIHWIDAGRSNLMQGYASSMAITDFLHSAGLLTDGANNRINLLSTIMDVTSIGNEVFGTIFGGGALGPTLRTSVEQNPGGGEGGDEAGAAAQAASLSSLTPAILAALA